MAGPTKQKDGEADSGKNNERGREKVKKTEGGRRREVYNWCTQ